MAESATILSTPVDEQAQRDLASSEQDAQSVTSEESPYDTGYRSYRYGYRPSYNSDDEPEDDDEGEEDPYQELFMNAYRSAPQSSDEEEETTGEGCLSKVCNPDAKPLSLMEDWDLWDYMDESELKERLKDHPRLLEEITRKRKRRMLEEEDGATAREDDELCDVMNRAIKCVRTETPSLTS
ncbi:uncharacterized protein LOC120902750 [Anopheles arabiensis]|uniref:Uncharacterized protein n=2 Tax=gambiae species complex TaxID=44542 RepID=A0A8W7Q0A9_ANOCL|nr:uncharacterized protein LOC120902750 [Anopheles arabiensis]